MRKADSDFIFEREVYDLLTNGIFKDNAESKDRDLFQQEARPFEEPHENYFEVLAQRFHEHSGQPSRS